MLLVIPVWKTWLKHQPVIDLLKSIIHQLQLKGEKFDTYDAAYDEEIEASWATLEQIDRDLDLLDQKWVRTYCGTLV